MSKLVYKPVGLILGAAAGALAGFAFRQVWQVATHEDRAPGVTEEDAQWGEILIAAALQGAIFALVKAAVDRGGATTFRRLTGTWPL